MGEDGQNGREGGRVKEGKEKVNLGSVLGAKVWVVCTLAGRLRDGRQVWLCSLRIGVVYGLTLTIPIASGNGITVRPR